MRNMLSYGQAFYRNGERNYCAICRYQHYQHAHDIQLPFKNWFAWHPGFVIHIVLCQRCCLVINSSLQIINIMSLLFSTMGIRWLCEYQGKSSYLSIVILPSPSLFSLVKYLVEVLPSCTKCDSIHTFDICLIKYCNDTAKMSNFNQESILAVLILF